MEKEGISEGFDELSTNLQGNGDARRKVAFFVKLRNGTTRW